MTNRQMYQCLARIAAHRCADEKKFVFAGRIGNSNVEQIQQKIIALLEKLDYHRFHSEFKAPGLRIVRSRAEQRFYDEYASVTSSIITRDAFERAVNVMLDQGVSDPIDTSI